METHVSLTMLLMHIPKLSRHARLQPLAILLKNGVPCALSSDDPAVFTNHGLTHDLYQFYAHTRSFDLFSIKCLLQGSIEGSLIDNKPDRVREWQAKWTAWVRAVVDELQ